MQPAQPAYRAPAQPVRRTYQAPRAVQPAYRPQPARPVPQVVPLKPPVQIAYDTHSPGTLGYGDGYESGFFKELYAFEGTAGEPIIVNLIGSDDARMQLDPLIKLIAPNGEVVAEDDNSGRDAERGDARIQTTLPETGTYSILVTTAKAYDRGRYTIGLILDD
ncbi:MAG: PPC domain-containing protein [Cyanobacteria bacterium P01_F01_bin.33]